MKLNTRKQMQWFCLITGLIIGLQIISILIKGNTFCLNDGCRIVENLTTIPPLYFNIIGFLYFLILFAVINRFGSTISDKLDLIRLLLNTGMAVESVLLAYQITVAHVLCVYCLFIFTVIFLLNVLYGSMQWMKSLAMVIAVNLIFLLLGFGPSLVLSKSLSLSAGTYATSKCSNPTKELYLIFSEDCPHCIHVVRALKQCNSCDFHFNPIDRIQSLDMTGLIKSDRFDPEINRIILALLGIDTVPVLLARNPDGFVFVHGEDNIINYIEKACFRQAVLPYSGITGDTSHVQQGMSININTAPEGECSVTEDCE